MPRPAYAAPGGSVAAIAVSRNSAAAVRGHGSTPTARP